MESFSIKAGKIAYDITHASEYKKGSSEWGCLMEDLTDEVRDIEDRFYTDEECAELGRLILDGMRLVRKEIKDCCPF